MAKFPEERLEQGKRVVMLGRIGKKRKLWYEYDPSGEALHPSKWMRVSPGKKGAVALPCSKISASGSAPSWSILEEHLESVVGRAPSISAPGIYCLVFLGQDHNMLFLQKSKLGVTECVSLKLPQWHVSKEMPVIQQDTVAFRSPRSLKQQGRVGYTTLSAFRRGALPENLHPCL